MRQERVLRHEFVEHIPTQLEDGTIYISVQFATAVHPGARRPIERLWWKLKSSCFRNRD